MIKKIIGNISQDEHLKRCPNVEKHGDLCKGCVDIVEEQGVAYDSRNE